MLSLLRLYNNQQNKLASASRILPDQTQPVSCSWYSRVIQELPASKDNGMEAEEQSLLGAITKQRLMKP
jgi:hypothetical protein